MITSCGGGSASPETTLPSYVIPDVVGLPFTSAKSALETAGWKVTMQEIALTDLSGNNPRKGGDVASQSPKANAVVSDHGTIQLSVIPDHLVVPDVRHLTRDEAFTQLTGLGFTVKVTLSPGVLGEPGTVLSSDPSSGAVAKPGSSVVIVVALPRTHTLSLNLLVQDNLWEFIGDAGCEFTARNLAKGRTVQLVGPDGSVLSAQTLDAGKITDTGCSWDLSFPNVPEVASYTITVSESTETWATTSLASMRSQNWVDQFVVTRS